jgi:ABC-type Zn uptake system ZnuABC Zn-binding protein ZnuA
MTTRSYRTLALVAALLVSAFIVPAASTAETAEELRIVCADTILADFTENVVGDIATVEYLRPAGICPSHYDARPSDASEVAGADIIVQLGWEGWLNDLVDSSGNPEVPRVRCSGLDEWNYPEGAKAHVDKIAEGLSAILPEHAATIDANAVAYKAQIDTKAGELLSKVVAEGVKGRQVVCMEWQVDFVEWLGFDVVATYAPPETLSLAAQLNVTEVAASGDVVMIVDNLQSGTDFGAHVASETGVSHVILTNFPSAYPNTYTYLDMVESNTDKLIDGAKTFEYKRGDIAELESQVQDLEFQNALLLTMAVLCLCVALFMGIVLVRSRSRGE